MEDGRVTRGGHQYYTQIKIGVPTGCPKNKHYDEVLGAAQPHKFTGFSHRLRVQLLHISTSKTYLNFTSSGAYLEADHQVFDNHILIVIHITTKQNMTILIIYIYVDIDIAM